MDGEVYVKSLYLPLNFVINPKHCSKKIKTSKKLKYNLKNNLGGKKTKPKSSRRKSIIKTRVEKNEIKKRKTIGKNQ